jgi:hypothetical protein
MLDDSHYKNYLMQPIEVHDRHNLNYTAQAFLKYVTRYNHKQGLRDLEQARDFCIRRTAHEIERGHLQVWNSYGLDRTIKDYCYLNDIRGDQRDAIISYFEAVITDQHHTEILADCYASLDRFIKTVYP